MLALNRVSENVKLFLSFRPLFPFLLSLSLCVFQFPIHKRENKSREEERKNGERERRRKEMKPEREKEERRERGENGK